MPTVAELTLAIAECLILPTQGITTDTLNASTVIDATLEEPDEYFDGGTVWLLSGLNAGKTGIIQSWDYPTKKFTLLAAMANPILTGTVYAAMDARYPRNMLIAALNKALKEIGPFTQKNETLTIVDDQVRYALPAGVSDIKRVQFATQDTEPYGWTAPHHWWKEHAGELILDDFHLPPATLAGNKIRIWYEAPHARLQADTDQVTSDVAAERIAWHGAWVAARNRNARPETSDNLTRAAEEQAMRQALGMQTKHPVRRMEKDQQWPNYV